MCNELLVRWRMNDRIMMEKNVKNKDEELINKNKYLSILCNSRFYFIIIPLS